MGVTADPWPALAAAHGRKSVMSLSIDDTTLDAETARQWEAIGPIMRPLLSGDEGSALDFGCGAGRFTAQLADLIPGITAAFDPCRELLAMVPTHERVRYLSELPSPGAFDLIFVWVVLGNPSIDLEATAAGLVSMLVPRGLLFIADHMPETAPRGRWWQFYPRSKYLSLFARYGLALREVGRVAQLGDEITILAGRRQ